MLNEETLRNDRTIERKDMQYLFRDGDLCNFMDMDNYEQIVLSAGQVGDALRFVKENETCKICFREGEVLAVEPPLFVELAVTALEPVSEDGPVAGMSRPATVETGARVYVPLSVNEGDTIRIDTRTGEYLAGV